jgi:hypothetical protein
MHLNKCQQYVYLNLITNKKHGDGGPLIQSQQVPVVCLFTHINDNTTHRKNEKRSLEFKFMHNTTGQSDLQLLENTVTG